MLSTVKVAYLESELEEARRNKKLHSRESKSFTFSNFCFHHYKALNRIQVFSRTLTIYLSVNALKVSLGAVQ